MLRVLLLVLVNVEGPVQIAGVIIPVNILEIAVMISVKTVQHKLPHHLVGVLKKKFVKLPAKLFQIRNILFINSLKSKKKLI